MDTTENFRRNLVGKINNEIESNDENKERNRLSEQYGQVWDTNELSTDFEIDGFMAPYVVARRKSDNKHGTLMFQHLPRFYFHWCEYDPNH